MEQLLEILTELHPEVDFNTEEHLIDNKILDSFDIVTIVAEIDSEFDVSIPAEELVPENFNSAQALYALVERLMEDKEANLCNSHPSAFWPVWLHC